MNRSFIFLFLFFLSCNTNKYAATNKDYKRQVKQISKEIRKQPLNGSKRTWVGTTNFGIRKPDYVIIHHTAQNSCDQTLRTFTLPRTQVSAHYVICKDGTLHHMLNDYLRAWHAGASSWGNNKDINSSSIGIELDNNGFEPFPDAQINSLLTLLDTLKNRYNIPKANFIGHGDIAPIRKNDPNVNFPWKDLSSLGFGLWHGDTSAVVLPENFNSIQALRIIGFSVKDTSATIRQFKRHYLQAEGDSILNEADKKILFDLMRQSM